MDKKFWPTKFVSLLDNDMYKFTMGQAVFKLFPNEIVRYEFTDRNNTKYPPQFKNWLLSRISSLKELKFKKDELKWLQDNMPFDFTYLNFLKNFYFKPHYIKVDITNDGELKLVIEGPWFETIFYEVPLLAIISELYSKFVADPAEYLKEIKEKINKQKIEKLSNEFIPFSDFGTRRRSSFENHEKVINDFINYTNENPFHSFIGTSNLYFAYKYNLKPIGTYAHEWIMFHGAKFGYQDANKLSLKHWSKVFNGELGIALTDTYTSPIFLKSFDSYYARLYDGVRQDSGDPIKFGEQIIEHYKKLGINPKSKVIVFSDSLTYDKAIQIHNIFKGQIKVIFGIGTHLTNDIGKKASNIVIKMSHIKDGNEWKETIKLSDVEGKHHGSKKEIELALKTLKIKK